MTMPMTAQALLTVEEWGLLPEDDARELDQGRGSFAEIGLQRPEVGHWVAEEIEFPRFDHGFQRV